MKCLNAGGYVDCCIGTQACLAHMATPPGIHSSLLADDQSVLAPTRYLMQ